MQYSTLKLAVATLAVSSDVVLGAVDANKLVTDILTLTTKSQALQGPVNDINSLSGTLNSLGLGPIPVSELYTKCAPLSLLRCSSLDLLDTELTTCSCKENRRRL